MAFENILWNVFWRSILIFNLNYKPDGPWIYAHFGIWNMCMGYTPGWNVWGEWVLAVNHHNHKNWVPSILIHNLWLIFMWMKQKNFFFEKKIKITDSKKVHFSRSPILNFFLSNGHIDWAYQCFFHHSILLTQGPSHEILQKILRIGNFEKRSFFQKKILLHPYEN